MPIAVKTAYPTVMKTKKTKTNLLNLKRNRGKSQLSSTLVLITLTIYL